MHEQCLTDWAVFTLKMKTTKVIKTQAFKFALKSGEQINSGQTKASDENNSRSVTPPTWPTLDVRGELYYIT